MEYQQLVQELTSPKMVFEDGELKNTLPPTSLNLRAARAIQALVSVVQGLEKSIKNEHHFDQRSPPGSGSVETTADGEPKESEV